MRRVGSLVILAGSALGSLLLAVRRRNRPVVGMMFVVGRRLLVLERKRFGAVGTHSVSGRMLLASERRLSVDDGTSSGLARRQSAVACM